MPNLNSGMVGGAWRIRTADPLAWQARAKALLRVRADVAAVRPVAHMVFLKDFIPIPGQPFSDQFGEDDIFPPTPESTWPIARDDPADMAAPAAIADEPAVTN